MDEEDESNCVFAQVAHRFGVRRALVPNGNRNIECDLSLLARA